MPWVVLFFVWGCGGAPEQPKESPSQAVAPAKGAPATPAQPAGAIEDEGYEELDVWIEAEPDEGPPPLRVQFTSEVESDEEGPASYRYRWDFGDGSTSGEANPVHTYGKLGEYTVTLVVTDDKGNNGSDEIDVWVEEEEE